MTSKFLNPRSVGPDPTSKMGGKKFKKKNLMRHYNNNFLGQELYFDVDFKMDSFDDSAKMTKRVIHWLGRKFGVTPEELTIVFSGGKGFHVIMVRLGYFSYCTTPSSYLQEYYEWRKWKSSFGLLTASS